MGELPERAKAMDTTTQLEMTNVTVQKIHGLSCNLNGFVLNCNKQNYLEVTQMRNRQPSLVEGKKLCRVCGIEKPITEFKLCRSRNSIYRRGDCLECEKKWFQDYYVKNREWIRPQGNAAARATRKSKPDYVRAKYRGFTRLYREQRREVIYQAYGNKCACCGEKEPLFLTIDHVNNDGKDCRKNGVHPRDSFKLYNWIIENNFPKMFQLLCMNCNWGKARNKGVCPHQKGSTVIAKASSSKQSEAPISPAGDEDMTSTHGESHGSLLN